MAYVLDDRNITPAMSSNNSASPVVASAQNEANGQACVAFNHINDASYWGGNATPNWIKIDMGTSRLIHGYRIVRSAVGAYYPTAWTFEGSNDDLGWDTIETQSGQAPPEEGTYYKLAAPVTYRFYRWTITANSSLGRPVIGEIELIDERIWASPTMTAANAPSPNVVSQSSQYSDTYAGWKAFDRNPSSRWATGSGQASENSFVQIYLGETGLPVVTSMTLSFFSNAGLKGFKLQGSDDGSAWTDIYTGAGDNATTPQIFTFSNTSAYKYLRVLCTEGWDANSLSIYEIRLDGAIPDAASASFTPRIIVAD